MHKIITTLKWLTAAAAMIALFAYAGKSDYQDAVIQEMKNNGTYYALSEDHPDWDEAQMVEAYQQTK